MGDDPELRRLLWFLLGGSRGGENRARLIIEIRSRPSNMNQLSKSLSLDYRSVQHHMGVLSKSMLVVSSGEHYGLTFSLHPWLEAHYDIFLEICKKLGFSDSPSSSLKDAARE